MKIKYNTPIVEMQGDEMTRILWDYIKEILIEPYVELNTEFYDLGLPEREKTQDQVTRDAANAIKKYKVGVKCATITPNAQRVEEYNLSKMWLSPNGTIRAILDGTVFRAPVLVNGITPYIPTWTKPITIARHAYGDVYKNSELKIDGPCTAELKVTYADGRVETKKIFDFNGEGIIQGIHNTDASISSFARSCFNYALSTKQNVWFATKDTISKTYDHRFKDIFQEIYDAEYKQKFDENGIWYDYTLIDDSVARIIRSNGGFIWALKNYDGHLKGEETSTNSVATIYAWTGALRKRGELENNNELIAFANKLEKATVKTIENGYMTKDLVGLFKKEGVEVKPQNSREFLERIAETLKTI